MKTKGESSGNDTLLQEGPRTVTVVPPSFPIFPTEQNLASKNSEIWQVLCGDREHWRCGIYSPQASASDQVNELEQHTCPELFLLLEGKLTLVLDDGLAEREVQLQPGKPLVVSVWHSGYCPQGPFSGRALVIERDRFTTQYRRRRALKGKG